MLLAIEPDTFQLVVFHFIRLKDTNHDYEIKFHTIIKLENIDLTIGLIHMCEGWARLMRELHSPSSTTFNGPLPYSWTTRDLSLRPYVNQTRVWSRSLQRYFYVNCKGIYMLIHGRPLQLCKLLLTVFIIALTIYS